jgi:CubicO group peptidase (beta-lactamase class C family)
MLFVRLPVPTRCWGIATCRVPADLGTVTTIGAAEVDPAAAGMEAEGVRRIWSAVERLYRSGIHPAIQLCVRYRGHVVIDRAIGHARGNGPDDAPTADKELVTPETPFTIYSASKAITAMMVHLLDERNLLRLDDPVCEYIPEFGTGRKQWITIRHILTHRAGIPSLDPDALDLDLISQPERIVEILCDAEPTWRPGRTLAYHTITGGFVIAEIVRRVWGRDIRALMAEAVCQPLRFRWMNYGVRPADIPRVARNYFTGPPVLPPASYLMRRALSADMRRVVELSNDPRFLLGIIPAANIVATANELSRFYQLLLRGGELDGVRVFERRTIRRATVEHSYLELDLTLALPLRYGLGFILGGRWFSLYGPDTNHAFGHLGFTNIISWADPQRQVAATLMTSGKPFLYPQLYHLFEVLRQIGRACGQA